MLHFDFSRSDADRLHTDTVGDIRKARDEKVVKAAAKVVVMRAEKMHRDETRWTAMEEKTNAEFARWDSIRADENNTLARRGKPRFVGFVNYSVQEQAFVRSCNNVSLFHKLSLLLFLLSLICSFAVFPTTRLICTTTTLWTAFGLSTTMF
jgi:hypothetical protein